MRLKLKAASQQEKLQKKKEYFKSLLGNPPEITDSHTEEIINDQQDIKYEHFTENKMDSVWNTIKSRKPAGFDEIPHEEWKIKKKI